MNKKILFVILGVLVIIGGVFIARKFIIPQNFEVDRGEEDSNIIIFVTADGADGEKIGCDDNLIPYEVATNAPVAPEQHLKLAIQTVLITKPVGDRQMNNALLQSQLTVDSVTIDSSGKATVKLSGNFSLSGVCDIPRVENQLQKTALVVPGVNSIEIFVNGIPLTDVLSQK